MDCCHVFRLAQQIFVIENPVVVIGIAYELGPACDDDFLLLAVESLAYLFDNVVFIARHSVVSVQQQDHWIIYDEFLELARVDPVLRAPAGSKDRLRLF